MKDILAQLVAAKNSGRPTVYCRLVETRGSTPQKAGAAMLVFGDGSQAGTLGGGCVEAEVKRRALGLLAGGRAEILSFQLDSDYGWDDGLICGGRMLVLVDPLGDPAALEYFERFHELVSRGEGCCEAVSFDAAKSGLPAAACLLLDRDGRLVAASRANNDPATWPAHVLDNLELLANRPRSYAAAGMAYLPVLPRCQLVIVGGGHVGQAVGNMAADLDFIVTVVDDRPEYVSRGRFPRAEQLLSGDINRILPELAISPDAYCLIVTRGHNHDEEALLHLVDRAARYVGMIGSKRKIKLIFDDLLEQGISPVLLSRVYAPVGIDIGSQTVPEIAVSILAELIAHRNLNGQVPGRPSGVEVA